MLKIDTRGLDNPLNKATPQRDLGPSLHETASTEDKVAFLLAIIASVLAIAPILAM